MPMFTKLFWGCLCGSELLNHHRRSEARCSWCLWPRSKGFDLQINRLLEKSNDLTPAERGALIAERDEVSYLHKCDQCGLHVIDCRCHFRIGPMPGCNCEECQTILDEAWRGIMRRISV